MCETTLAGGTIRGPEPRLMDQVERTVLAELRLPGTDVGRRYGITLRHIVPALGQPIRDVARQAYDEGLSGR